MEPDVICGALSSIANATTRKVARAQRGLIKSTIAQEYERALPRSLHRRRNEQEALQDAFVAVTASSTVKTGHVHKQGLTKSEDQSGRAQPSAAAAGGRSPGLGRRAVQGQDHLVLLRTREAQVRSSCVNFGQLVHDQTMRSRAFQLGCRLTVLKAVAA